MPNFLNFLNEYFLSTFLALSIISFKDIKIKTWRWSANIIEPGQTAHLHSLTRLYTVGWPTSRSHFDILKTENDQFQKCIEDKSISKIQQDKD